MNKFNLILLVASISLVIIGAVLKIFLGANFLTSSLLVIGAVIFIYIIFKFILTHFTKSKSS